jgi:hypothetical protein
VKSLVWEWRESDEIAGNFGDSLSILVEMTIENGSKQG